MSQFGLKDVLKKFGDRMLETNIIHYLNTIIIYIPKYIVSHESPICVFKIIHCTQFYESWTQSYFGSLVT
jgi:hypothetical protein